MHDIQTKQDVQILVDTFYQQVLKDETIGHFFNHVAKINFEEHMPIMYAFWESMLFSTAIYKGNPMTKHIDLNQKERLGEEHFDHWIHLWNSTIDELFEGEIANKAKDKAKMMKLLMLHKIRRSESDNFLI